MWHFNDELKQYVSAFDEPDVKCQGCDFAPNGDREALVKHVAFEHDKLNELLQCKELVDDKRSQMKAKPKKPPKPCPICDMTDMSRDHIARHFGDELAAVVAEVSEIIIIPILWGEKPQANHSPSNFFVKNSSK